MVRLWALHGPFLRSGLPRGFTFGGPTLWQRSQRRALVTLGIETSCDDTCVAVINTAEDGRFISFFGNDKITCPNKHHRGIHPVEAVKSHTRNLPELVRKALTNPKCMGKPDLIAVTRGPGMKPCLGVGISFAKALSLAWGVPLVGVHHMQAHALSIQLDAAHLAKSGVSEATAPDYPFLNLLVSGGHTMLVYTKSALEHRVLASTQRGIANPSEKGSTTAVGEMLDKCARDIVPPDYFAHRNSGAGTVVYAQQMENYCKVSFHNKMQHAYEAPQERDDEVQLYHSEKGSWYLPPPLRNTREMTYDFTGLGGKVRAIMQQNPDMDTAERRELAYHTMRLAFEHIMSRVILALQNDEELLATPPQSLVISGGVASNKFLRTVAASMLQARGFGHMDVRAPRPQYCVDNAAMIAWVGQKMYRAGWTTDLSFLPQDEWPIEDILTGVDCWVRKDGVKVPEPKAKVTDPQQQDKIELPKDSEPQQPPLSPTLIAPPEPVEVGAPDAGEAHRREAKVKAVTQDKDEILQIQIKSDHHKASAKPVPGERSSKDGQNAADSEDPASPQEGTAQSPPIEAADRPAQPTETPWARAPQGGTKAAEEPVHGNQTDPVYALQAAEKQLLTRLVQGSRRRAAPRRESSNGPRDRMALRQTSLAKPHARAAQVAKRLAAESTGPAGAAQKKSADKHRQVKQVKQAKQAKQASGSHSVDEARAASSSDVDQTPKPRIGPFGHPVDKARAVSSSGVDQTPKPRTKPIGQPVLKSKMAAEGTRVPGTDQAVRESVKIKEEKHEHKQTGGQKTPAPDRKTEDHRTKRRVVRLLQSAAEEPAPKGSLGMGLEKLKRWIGL